MGDIEAIIEERELAREDPSCLPRQQSNGSLMGDPMASRPAGEERRGVRLLSSNHWSGAD